MKVMILAAGRGERMRPLTDDCPKPLLKLNHKALIEYHLEALSQAGLKQVVINHAWLGQQIETYLEDGKKWQVSIQYSSEKCALETAGGIKQAIPLLTYTEPYFLVVNGDIFTDYPFAQLKQFKPSTLAHLILVPNPKHHPQGDFYLKQTKVYDEQSANIINGIKKYTYSGIALFHKDFFKDIKVGKQALAPLLHQAISQQQVTGELYHGLWSDIGTIERLENMEEELKKN